METDEVVTNDVENANDDVDESLDESSDAENGYEVDAEEWKLVDEEYISIDLIGLVKGNVLSDCDKNDVKLIGMFDEHPVLQIGKSFFVGDREEVPGTNVLFQVENRTMPESSDDEENVALSENRPRVKIDLKCTTRKKLVMRQAFLSKKKESGSQIL